MPRPGVRIVYNGIPGMLARTHGAVKDALEDTARLMEEDAKSRLVAGQFGYDTGQARESIHGVVTSQRTAELRGGGDEAPHFAFNEYGTKNRGAAPALEPAWEKYSGEFPLRLARNITTYNIRR